MRQTTLDIPNGEPSPSGKPSLVLVSWHYPICLAKFGHKLAPHLQVLSQFLFKVIIPRSHNGPPASPALSGLPTYGFAHFIGGRSFDTLEECC
jgi:hypothetical protein